MKEPKFEVRQSVYKHTGNYGGPGIVRGIANDDGQPLRYLVGHTIAGGFGEFFHVYAEGNLREIDFNIADLPTISKEEGLRSRTGQATPNAQREAAGLPRLVALTPEQAAELKAELSKPTNAYLLPGTADRLQFTAQELNLVRQWFNAVEDVAPEYLKTADFELGNRIIEQVKRDEEAAAS